MKSILLGLLLTISCTSLFGQESTFKALFTYKFAEYIEWESGNKNITVGVAGQTPVYDELVKLASSRSNFSIIKIDGYREVDQCNILLLSPDQDANTYKKAVGNKSILIVSEDRSYTGKGADIGFYLEEGKLRFLIDESSIRSKSMIPSSKLLALGNRI